ncbi:hypothetical protein [Pseudomonas sp. EA_65y_Pfl2_P78]|uniref:hypothetical protein n=1 Tax=Pseudomonas sp. EA_65y_Pfl2_P78 TaxID=3088695 RepID=UPI0030DCF05E
MAKPPKKISSSPATDTHLTSPKTLPHEAVGHLPHITGSDPTTSVGHVLESHARDTPQIPNELAPAVIVSDPSPFAELLQANMEAITWPADNIDQLRPLGGESGLFESPEGNTYAHVANEGYFRAERQADGRYRLHWPEQLGEQGPLIKQVEGQPYWRPEASSAAMHVVANVETAGGSPTPLSPRQAASLSSAQESPDGIRYDTKRRASYVDMEDGTTFLVRKHSEGGYQQAAAHDRNVLGARVEPIAGTKRWRIKTNDDQLPGSSKRQRLTDADQPPLVGPSTARLTGTQPTAGVWKSWGKSSKPEGSESIEIDGLHYVIVPQRIQDDTVLVYLQNPLFTPGRYDAFEQMLKTDPSLQPKWVIKSAGAWAVLEQNPFAVSLNEYVGKSMRYLSSDSSNAIAKAVFNQANQSETINGDGLTILFDTLYHWQNRSTVRARRPELADPLLMLRALLPSPGNNLPGHKLLLPSPSAEPFSRLDFDASRFLISQDSSLRSIFSNLLESNGYEVDRTSRMFREDALLFERKDLDTVFVLRFPFPAIGGELLRTVGPAAEINDPKLRARLETSKWQRMLDYNKVVYLAGGMQKVSDQQTLFYIVRES